MKRLFTFLAISSSTLLAMDLDQFPSTYDLRNVNGKKFVSSVKSQNGGTCWTFATAAAVEGNLLMNGVWASSGETGEANLAEYHLDWWNGFNQYYNSDTAPQTGGLTVHQGGDYRVASAYLARGVGMVREVDAQSYNSAPKEKLPSYKTYYVRDIEWFTAGENLENIGRIKRAIMENGVIGTALKVSYLSNNIAYQPKSSTSAPDHAVAIVGWDDNKKTKAPLPGAWIFKNSWGTGTGQGGYQWISYYDKVAGRHPEMGAVSFKNTEVMQYNQIYYHDYHGWRDTKKNITEAFNAFTAKGATSGKESLKSVSFYTAADNVSYTIKIFSKYDGNDLSELMSVKEGVIENSGFHTVDLSWPVRTHAGDKFYVYLKLSDGGHPFDKTSNVPVLLGSSGRVTVKSKASPGESFYRNSSGKWIDFTTEEATGNFCMKALSIFE
jgi:C1A family cysteine protease